MRLIDLLASREEWKDEEIIYAVLPWNCDCEAVVEVPASDSLVPVIRDGLRYDYFLETFIAFDFIEDYTASREQPFSEQEICERLIQYAINDA